MIVVILQSSPHGNIADGASDALLASAAGHLLHDVRLVGISDDPCEADILFPRADLRISEHLDLAGMEGPDLRSRDENLQGEP